MFCTKFTPSVDRIQLLKVIMGSGFTLRHRQTVFGSICLFVNNTWTLEIHLHQTVLN